MMGAWMNVDEWIDGWVNGWRDRWMDGGMDEWCGWVKE